MTESDTSDEIMEATYRALCTHGYASLTMQDIADELDVSTAALHYHYDSKRGLLLAFLDYLYEEFTDRVRDPAGETAVDRIERFVDSVLVGPESDADERVAIRTALLELKAQAPYDEAVRERLERFDAFLRDRIRGLVAAGIAEGTVRDVDPEDTARFLVTALDGASSKQVSVGQDPDCTRRTLHRYVRTHLAADGGRTVDRDPAGDRDDPDRGGDRRERADPDAGVRE